MPPSDREPRLDSADPAVLFAAYLDHYGHADHLDISVELAGGAIGE